MRSFECPEGIRFFPFCPLNRKENLFSLCALCAFAVIINISCLNEIILEDCLSLPVYGLYSFCGRGRFNAFQKSCQNYKGIVQPVLLNVRID